MAITSSNSIFAVLSGIVVLNKGYEKYHFLGAWIVIIGLVLTNFSKFIECEEDEGHESMRVDKEDDALTMYSVDS